MIRSLASVYLFALAMTLAACSTTSSDTSSTRSQSSANPAPPNVVIFFTDDQGYGDLSAYGHPTIHTPNIDRMAAQGMKLTQFYTSQPLCSPSRASLLTGSYAKRINMHKHVIFPQYDYGMHTDEHTIADMLSDAGYATGMFGKWHLGHRPGLLPTDQGFDTFYGIPYSNDMSQFQRKSTDQYRFNLPLMRDDKVLEWEPDQRNLTKRCTEEAVAFIEKNQDKPFFVYIPHAMPHIPIYASQDFEGTSKRGLYGDVIEEIDWSVGQVLSKLEALGLEDNTIVMFSSDNGPWAPFRQYGGTAGPLRGAKGTNWEGGQRVPFVIQWPGKIPANTICTEVVTAMDILPTLAELTPGKLSDNTIDGHPVADLLLGKPGATSPTEAFLYYDNGGNLAGIREGGWKLIFASRELNKEHDGEPVLYEINVDIAEQWDMAKRYPDKVKALKAKAVAMDKDIADHARPTRQVSETLWEWPDIKSTDPNPFQQGRGY